MTRPLLLGAVRYDPKVDEIWRGFAAVLRQGGVIVEPILFPGYDEQVRAMVDGQLDVAWHSPLAFLQAEHGLAAIGRSCRAFAMRDTDRDLRSVVVTRPGGPSTVAQLRGGRVAVGAWDSPQGTLLPLAHLGRLGLQPGTDVEVVACDVDVGLHGDHVGGERDAARLLAEGRVDAACMLDANHLAFLADGTLPPKAHVLARTAPYDHCLFAAAGRHRPAEVLALAQALLAMSWDDPGVRPLLRMEGLRRWMPGRTRGLRPLRAALAAGVRASAA